MKKFLILAALLFSFSALSAWDNFTFSLTPKAGVMYGQINEYVFSKFSKASQDKLSELDWDIKPAVIIGADLDATALKWIYFGGNMRTAFQGKTGLMVDRDWQNIDFEKSKPALVNSGTSQTALTNYSDHENNLKDYYSFSGKLGLNLPFVPKTNLRFLIMGKTEHIKFDGMNGGGMDGYTITPTGVSSGNVYEYGPYFDIGSGKYKPKDFSDFGKVISYEQYKTYFYVGFDADTKIIPHLYLKTAFFWSPSFSVNAYDTHWTNLAGGMDGRFFDYIKGSGAMETDFQAAFSFNKNHSLGFDFSWEYIPVTKGNTYDGFNPNTKKVNPQNINHKCLGGTGSSIFFFNLFYKFTL
ncbi:MAG: omptin family outer membrane protease [Treponema sp.]|nr:omptin family outer membrane protease [Treponema sp.]